MRINPVLNVSFKRNTVNLQKPSFFKTSPCAYDSVSFGNIKNDDKITRHVENSEGIQKVIQNLSTATSGHRAPYPSETFNPQVVTLITLGVAQYAKNHNRYEHKKPIVVIGGDTRRATIESLPNIQDTLVKQGVDVIYIDKPVPTPILALVAKKSHADISILMTASHNPWSDGGFNFITSDGAVAPGNVTKKIAKNMDNIVKTGYYKEDIKPTGFTFKLNPYQIYKNNLERSGLIDFKKIENSGIKVYYDGMKGTGSYIMPQLLEDFCVDFEEIHSSGQTGPQPTENNLEALESIVYDADDNLKIGLTNDGDADRFGIIDENGNYIDPNDVLLLVAYHLIKNKGLRGDIVRSHATSRQIDEIAQKYNLQTHVTPVGFKYIASDILQARKEGRDIIIAGEESGGLTAYGQLPEKDGLLADFLILDLMAHENKPIGKILEEIKENTGIYYQDNYSKRIKDNETKERILGKVENRYKRALSGETDFGETEVDIRKTLRAKENIEKYRSQGDGFMFVLKDNSTVLIRKSGTEPLLRFYIETLGDNINCAKQKADSLKEYIEEEFSE